MGNILDAIQEMDKMKKDIGRDAYNEIRELQSRVDWLEKEQDDVKEKQENKDKHQQSSKTNH